MLSTYRTTLYLCFWVVFFAKCLRWNEHLLICVCICDIYTDNFNCSLSNGVRLPIHFGNYNNPPSQCLEVRANSGCNGTRLYSRICDTVVVYGIRAGDFDRNFLARAHGVLHQVCQVSIRLDIKRWLWV